MTTGRIALQTVEIEPALRADLGDALGMGATYRRHQNNAKRWTWIDGGEYGEAVDAVLRGRGGCRVAMRDLILAHGDDLMDETSARLLASVGIDPTAALAFAILASGSISPRLDGANLAHISYMHAQPRCCVVAVPLSGQVAWNSDHGLRIDGLPGSVVNSAIGRRVGEMVDHPAFAMPMTIVAHDDSDGRDWFAVSGGKRLTSLQTTRITPDGWMHEQVSP